MKKNEINIYKYSYNQSLFRTLTWVLSFILNFQQFEKKYLALKQSYFFQKDKQQIAIVGCMQITQNLGYLSFKQTHLHDQF